MSNLNQLKVDQLKALIGKVGLDEELSGDEKKADLVKLLSSNGVDADAYDKFFNAGGPQEEVVFPQAEPVDQVLLKMDRKNPTFQAFGHKFTREHPYAIVDEDIAQKIIDKFDGFRLASPREAKSYYG